MKEKLSRLLDSRKFYLTLSILLAVLYWLVLSMADDSDIEKTIYNVPVQMGWGGSAMGRSRWTAPFPARAPWSTS